MYTACVSVYIDRLEKRKIRNTVERKKKEVIKLPLSQSYPIIKPIHVRTRAYMHQLYYIIKEKIKEYENTEE